MNPPIKDGIAPNVPVTVPASKIVYVVFDEYVPDCSIMLKVLPSISAVPVSMTFDELVGETSMVKVSAAPRVRSPSIFIVPIEFPGLRVPPDPTTFPVTVPVPPRVPDKDTLEVILPFTLSLPACISVVPVYVLAPDNVRVPVPAFTTPPPEPPPALGTAR